MPTKYTGETVAQFGTLCGAVVDLIELHQPQVNGTFTHRWVCRGCGERQPGAATRSDARTRANDHAFSCRSLPRTA